LVFCRYAEIKEWAPEIVKLFKTLFNSGRGTYLDIGAHIGLTVVPIAAEGVTCHAFEPGPRSLAFLRENIVENGVTEQVTAWPVALSDAPGRVRFVLSPVTSGSNCFWAAGDGVRGEESWPVIEVEAARLDDLITPNIAKPLGAKIDCEGSEPQVFAGGAKLLASADLIVTEFFPYMMRRLGGNVAAEIDFLRSHFCEGTILVDEYDVPQWRPIAELTTELDRIWNGLNSGTWDIWGDPKRRIWYDQNQGLACCDVVVRK
jgi:FkbM family methyltransferase